VWLSVASNTRGSRRLLKTAIAETRHTHLATTKITALVYRLLPGDLYTPQILVNFAVYLDLAGVNDSEITRMQQINGLSKLEDI
jgi:hypothetical protein